jgi:hypothetical protein
MSKVDVSVVNGAITVVPDILPMGGQGHNATIEWKLHTPGWTFPSDGIVIDGNDGQFKHLRPIDKGLKFQCTDANNDAKPYKYNVKVTDGKTTLELDPIIQNGDGTS